MPIPKVGDSSMIVVNAATILHVIEQAIFSKIGGVIAASIITHLAIVKAKAAKAVAAVKAAEEKAVAEIKDKFDALAEEVRADAEHDEIIVKATLAKFEADVRKIF